MHLTISQDPQAIQEEALAFIAQYGQEKHWPEAWLQQRQAEIRAEWGAHQTWTPSYAELAWGCRVAWRNSNRCVGRLTWSSLQVIDARHLRQPAEIIQALRDYLRRATQGGRIQSTILVLPPEDVEGRAFRVWNPQLIRYAGYRQPDGSVLGDPAMVSFTERVRALGWLPPSSRTAFDLLPVVVEAPGHAPVWFEWEKDEVLEVSISHPEVPAIAELGLRWHAVPAISDMNLRLGGLNFTAAPFNGYYMGTEIGARNLADPQRYNQLPRVAAALGLDTRRARSLWQDRALVELNRAVLHSFQQASVSMIDHHRAGKQFERFIERETDAGREVQADWAWIVPPLSGATHPAFFREFPNQVRLPNFLYQPPAWQPEQPPRRSASACPFHQ